MQCVVTELSIKPYDYVIANIFEQVQVKNENNTAETISLQC